MLLDDSWLQEPPNILKDMIILHSKGKNISSNKGGCLRKKKTVYRYNFVSSDEE